MNIVLEGPDNSGKSTLARMISHNLTIPIISSKGREKYPGELEERVSKYLMMDRVIFDRHTVVSNYVYSHVTPRRQLASELVARFYNSSPLFIYCRSVPSRGLKDHVLKRHDDPEFLKQLEIEYPRLCTAYDSWALNHAFMTYRIGDDMSTIIRAIEGVVS